jgi:hypothetical protein
VGVFRHRTATSGTVTAAYRDSARTELPFGGVWTLGSTRIDCAGIRARDPVLARSSRPRARYTKPSAPDASRAMPSPAQASSAMACRVSSASHSRQSRASASWLKGVPARARRMPHSWTRRRGIAPFLSSAQAHHCRAASATASGQSGTSAGGQFEPAGGDRAKRYASERWRITSVSANRSGGHSSSSSPIVRPTSVRHTDAGVGS